MCDYSNYVVLLLSNCYNISRLTKCFHMSDNNVKYHWMLHLSKEVKFIAISYCILMLNIILVYCTLGAASLPACLVLTGHLLVRCE